MTAPTPRRCCLLRVWLDNVPHHTCPDRWMQPVTPTGTPVPRKAAS